MAQETGTARLVALIRAHALIQGGDFELASGARATTYIDLRRVTMHPEGADLIADLLFERCRDAGADSVGGMATAAIPPVACLVLRSHERGRPLRGFYVRDKAKTRGTQRQIEGQLDKGDRVVLIEDTMTSGRSTMAAVEAVRAEGSTVVKVVTVVDREQGGAGLYAAEGIPFEALVTLSDITGG